VALVVWMSQNAELVQLRSPSQQYARHRPGEPTHSNDGAQSELIVDSGHGAQTNPEAIHEIARILKENLAVASR